MTAHTLDLKALEAWMRAHVDDFSGSLQAEKFAGGQSNPTFKLTAGDQRYVLRRKPPGELLKSAHAVDREFKVISALEASPVPVAKAIALAFPGHHLDQFQRWTSAYHLSLGAPSGL